MILEGVIQERLGGKGHEKGTESQRLISRHCVTFRGSRPSRGVNKGRLPPRQRKIYKRGRKHAPGKFIRHVKKRGQREVRKEREAGQTWELQLNFSTTATLGTLDCVFGNERRRATKGVGRKGRQKKKERIEKMLHG